MKLEYSFDNFLKNTVNLDETRYQTAKSGIETVTKILKNDDLFKDKFVSITPQGSFRQETIIKPVKSDIDFDVDILFEVKPVSGWQPADYLNKLSTQLKKLDRYKDKIDTRGKTRCVTIDYESDFHIDIVPSISTSNGSLVMNKTTNQYEVTDGDGYAQWFSAKNNVTGGKYLTKTVRLLKYIRDSQGKFDIKSIVLTTLLGNQVLSADKTLEQYPDLPTTFTRLISRLDSYLQANPTLPSITNPVLSSESFNRRIDQAVYSKFRNAIHTYSQLALEAYKESDQTKSLKGWQKIFGEKFTYVTKGLIPLKPVSLARDPGEQFLKDFNISEQIKYNVNIDARVEQDGFRPFSLRGAIQRLRKQRKLEFMITNCDVPSPYSVKWKIKNIGTEARNSGDLRGEIVDDKGFQTRKESTKYEGQHYVECYVIKDGVCVAKDRVDVPIGQM